MEGRKISLVAANTTILAILNVSLLCSGEASNPDVIVRPKAYDLSAIIQPENGQINVEGQIAINFVELPQRSFSFNIHETLTVDRLRIGNGPVWCSSTPNPPTLIVPASKRIVFELPSDFREDSCELEISYKGVLKDIPEFGSSEDQKYALDDQINSNLVELALCPAWYPQFDIGTKFDVDLEVSLPGGWIAVCTGNRSDEREIAGRQ